MKGAWLLGTAAACAFFLGPIAWLLSASLRPEAALTAPGVPVTVTLANYAQVLAGRGFIRALGNSVAVASATTALGIALGSVAAFALALLPMKGARVLLAAALSASMLPPIATVSPLFLTLRALGLYDRLGGLVLTHAGFALPFTLWSLNSVFRALPAEVYRAARVDGCSAVQAFWRVMVPLARPGLATTAIIVFILSWNEFLFALSFTASPARRTVPVAIALFEAQHQEPWAQIAAASVLATLPLAAVAVMFQRRIVAGLVAGAVKG